MLRIAIASVVAFSLASALPAEAQTASGSFKASTGTIAPSVAAAYVVRDQFNPQRTSIEIILSMAPLDIAAAIADLSPHQVIINDPKLKDANYVLVWVTSDGKVSMNATFGKTMTQYVDRADPGGSLRAELTTNTPDRVAGHLSTPAPVKTMDGSIYAVDLTFSAPVAKPPAGTALAAGGGEPGKALTAFFAARQKKDWPALKAALSPEMIEKFVKSYNNDKENLDDLLSTLDFWLPTKNAKIGAGTLRGDTAVLDVEGTLASGINALTLVRLVKGPSGWLFDRATMAGMLK